MSLLERTVSARKEDLCARRTFAGAFSRLLHLPRQRFVRNVATLTLGTAMAQSVNVALTPVITRLYSPSDLGVLGLFISFLGVAGVMTSLNYEPGIVSTATEEDAARLTLASMLLTVPLSVLSGVALYTTIHFSWWGYGILPAWAVPLMVATLLLAGTFASLRYWNIRQEGFGIIAKAVLFQQSVRSLSQTILGLAGIGSAGLLCGEMMGRGAGIWSLLRHAVPALKLAVKSPRREITRSLRENRKLATYSLPSSLIDTLAVNMLVPLFIALYGPSIGGQFALMQRVLALPLVLIATSVADTFHSRLAICAREEPSRLPVLFKRTTAGLFFLGLGPALILFFAGERLFAFAFGQPWATAGTFASVTAPLFLAQMVVNPLSRLVFVLRGQESKLVYDLTALAGILLTFKVARTYKLSAEQAILAITITNTFSYIVYYLVLRRIVVKTKLGLPTRSPQEP